MTTADPLALAAVFCDAGRAEDALREIDRVGESADSLGAWRLRADALLQLGRVADAREAAARAVAADISDTRALLLLSVTARLDGDEDVALEAGRQARVSDPQDWRTHIAVVLAAADDPSARDEVESSMRIASSLAPDEPDVHAVAGDLLLRTTPQGAVEAYDRALAIAPDHHHARHNRAVAQLRAGRHGDAARNLAALLGLDPSDRLVALNLRAAVLAVLQDCRVFLVAAAVLLVCRHHVTGAGTIERGVVQAITLIPVIGIAVVLARFLRAAGPARFRLLRSLPQISPVLSSTGVLLLVAAVLVVCSLPTTGAPLLGYAGALGVTVALVTVAVRGEARNVRDSVDALPFASAIDPRRTR